MKVTNNNSDLTQKLVYAFQEHKTGTNQFRFTFFPLFFLVVTSPHVVVVVVSLSLLSLFFFFFVSLTHSFLIVSSIHSFHFHSFSLSLFHPFFFFFVCLRTIPLSSFLSFSISSFFALFIYKEGSFNSNAHFQHIYIPTVFFDPVCRFNRYYRCYFGSLHSFNFQTDTPAI